MCGRVNARAVRFIEYGLKNKPRRHIWLLYTKRVVNCLAARSSLNGWNFNGISSWPCH